jgi:putative ABC transport system substrate-binding protein
VALGLVAWLPHAAAQPQSRVARIGFLGAESEVDAMWRVERLRTGLRDLGYEEGRNFVIDARWADGRYERLPELANDLVRLKVDVIVTAGTKAVLGARQATTSMPIVMQSSGDIVSLGVVESLAHPGGNVTGSTNAGRELGPKHLELVREALPRATRIAYLVNPDNAAFGPNLKAMWSAARALKVQLQVVEVRGPSEYENTFAELARQRVDGIVLQEDTSFVTHAQRVGALATKHRIMAASNVGFPDAGGVIGYGPSVREMARRAAYFVDRTLKGAKPGDLPIEQPTRFQLVINARAAKALDVTVP